MYLGGGWVNCNITLFFIKEMWLTGVMHTDNTLGSANLVQLICVSSAECICSMEARMGLHTLVHLKVLQVKNNFPKAVCIMECWVIL